jgi:hypothetical protein
MIVLVSIPPPRVPRAHVTSVRTGSGDVSVKVLKAAHVVRRPSLSSQTVKKQKAIEIRHSALIFDGALQTGTTPARLPAQPQGAQAETEQGSDGVYRH